MPEPGRVGELKRPVEVKADVLRAPRIVKADVKKMRAQSELQNNAELVEFVAAPGRKAVFDRDEEAFSSLVPDTAEIPALLGSTKRREFTLDIDGRF